jgi:ribosomal protein S27E
MLTRRRKKLTKAQAIRETGRKFLECSSCHMEEVEVSTAVSNVICSVCVQKLVAPPPMPKVKSNKPRGWHLKPFIELDGVVYSKGIEVTDADEIKRLRKEFASAPTTPTKATAKKTAKKKVTKQTTKKVTKKVTKKAAKKTTKKGAKNARTTR